VTSALVTFRPAPPIGRVVEMAVINLDTGRSLNAGLGEEEVGLCPLIYCMYTILFAQPTVYNNYNILSIPTYNSMRTHFGMEKK